MTLRPLEFGPKLVPPVSDLLLREAVGEARGGERADAVLTAPPGDDLPVGDAVRMQARGLIRLAASAAHRVTTPRQSETSVFPRFAGCTAPPVLLAAVGPRTSTVPIRSSGRRRAGRLVASPGADTTGLTHHPRSVLLCCYDWRSASWVSRRAELLGHGAPTAVSVTRDPQPGPAVCLQAALVEGFQSVPHIQAHDEEPR